jgi:hypothetical protein
MDWCYYKRNITLYFRNLKFDGEFLFVWLFEHGYKHVVNREDITDNSFTTLISDKGQFYSIEIVFENDKKFPRKVTIYDSLKIIKLSIDETAKAFKLPIQKLEIDYDEYREIGHVITPEEHAYILNDVKIDAMALKTLFDQNLEEMTIGSNALYDYKQIITAKRFDELFPVPAYDSDIRQSYKGGFTYLSPRFKSENVGAGIVLDVNSLYPSVMYFNPLPYGEGIYFEGAYKPDKIYNLYVQMFTCNFELKENYIPTIQLKNNLAFIPTEYLTSSNNEDITLCLTSVDLQLFLEHYNVYNIEYHNGWKFKSTIGLFKNYIDKWNNIKVQATIDENEALRTIAKFMLNNLYGKFALNPNVQSKYPVYEDGKIRYVLGEKEMRKPIYIPVGTFITAWARYKTITSAQTVYDRFMYADTDSLHLLGTEMPTNLEISSTDLGKWKHESTFKRARYLRQKCYVEELIINEKKYNKYIAENPETKHLANYIDGEYLLTNITCAGMPNKCYEYVTWDNFTVGSSYQGKLQPVHVKGGIVLRDIDFTIKR